jgi:mannose-6-phosphate isomerase-like protein (cupin superfamily)
MTAAPADDEGRGNWGDPDGHMAGYWNPDRPLIDLSKIPIEPGAARMGDGFRHQKMVYSKTFMWDFDTMAPRMGTPYHSHYQDEAWRINSGRGVFRTEAGAFEIGPGDYLYLPGGHKHQIANADPEELLVYEVILVPPVTLDTIIIHEPFDESLFDQIA